MLDDRALTAGLKRTRHRITGQLRKWPVPYAELVSARGADADVGRAPSALEKRQKDFAGVFAANMERAKEALRALEETSRLLDKKSSAVFKKLRFEVYTLEKKAIARLEALRDHAGPKRRA